MTEEEIQLLRGVITKQVEATINIKMSQVENKVDHMSECIESLNRAIRGDSENQEPGLLTEHKEMYTAYKKWLIIIQNLPLFLGVNLGSVIIQIVLAIINNT